jgi:hypothetical protein
MNPTALAGSVVSFDAAVAETARLMAPEKQPTRP